MTFDDNEFLTSFRNICPKELDLKVERQGNHVSFLDHDIKVEDSVFVYKPLDKRDKFSLFMFECPICQAIYHLQFSLDLYFQNFFE